MRRLAALCAVFALTLAAGSGCGSGGVRYSHGRVEVRLWHSMSGVTGDALKKIVDGFNASQSEYTVVPIFQGGYADSLKKLVSSLDTSSMPALIQLDDIELRFMVDSHAIVPAQDFVDADARTPGSHPANLADFEPRALDYYTLNGKLQAMPFNLSGPVLYYDRDVFAQAGIDHPPATLDEVRADAQRLLLHNPDGSLKRNGIALSINGWWLEQMMAKQGALFANNGNGRQGLATKVLIDSPAGIAVLSWWQQMVRSGLATNVGTSGLQSLLAVVTGKSGMAIESVSALRAIVLALGPASARLGVAPMPAPPAPDNSGGMVLGGAAMWIMKGRPLAEQRGAWEFLKYAPQPQVQAQWHYDTGYFPVRVSAWDLEPAASLHRQYPQFAIAHDQVVRSPRNLATAGAVIGPFTQVREYEQTAFEQVLVGGKTPQEALATAAKDADRAIARYNRSVR